MDIEQKQAELIDHFTKQARDLKPGSSLENLVLEATSHPSLFAFSEILSALAELEGTQITQYTSSLNVLRLFAYGTWNDYKNNHGCLPTLLPDQVRKFKQLSVLTLAETSKVLSYDQLMWELDVSNVRELENFLINECMYLGIVRGKLDQLHRCFEILFAVGRDPRPDKLNNMIGTLTSWLSTSGSLLHTIQEKIKWADKMNEADKKHRKEIEDVKKILKANMNSGGLDEILHSDPQELMTFKEHRLRTKRRRRQPQI